MSNCPTRMFWYQKAVRLTYNRSGERLESRVDVAPVR